MASLRWGAASDQGQLRPQNEDNLHAADGLFVVADGMGGHLAGEVASAMAVSRLDQRLPGTATNTRDDLVAAITDVNLEIYNASVDNPEQAGMGTTITALAVVDDPHDGEVLAIANVGDSRGYVLRHGRLRQVTIDHSFVQELVAEGAISRDEARNHPRRNIVTRALGIEPGVRVDSWTMPLIRGDRFLLCSDGLVDEVTDAAIQALLLEQPDDPDATARALIDAANAAGGRDNVTAIVVDVLDGDDPPDPTEEFDVTPLWSDDDLADTGEVHIVADPLDDDESHHPSLGVPAAATSAATATTAALTDAAPHTISRPKRKRAIGRTLLALGVAAVLVLGFAIMAAWARSGFYVGFDDDDRVAIFQGRKGGFLWFEPTREARGQFTRDQLDPQSVRDVEDEREFPTMEDAGVFISESVRPTTTTSTTTTTTTTTLPPSTPTTTTALSASPAPATSVAGG